MMVVMAMLLLVYSGIFTAILGWWMVNLYLYPTVTALSEIAVLIAAVYLVVIWNYWKERR